MNKSGRLIVLAAALTTLFASVLPTSARQDKCPLDDGVVNIAWIPKALDNAVFELGRVGAETRAQEISDSDAGCAVEVFVAAPMNTDADEQASLLNDIVDAGTFDALAVSCIEPDACVEPINRAMDAGIATMTWDSDSPDSSRFTYYGTNNYEGGRAAGDLLVRAMGDSGKVALLSGVEGSQNLGERIRGFTDYVADYPGIEVVDIVYGNDDAVRSGELVEQVIADHPDLTGFFFVGLWPFTLGRGAMPGWEDATLNGGLKNVAFDTLPLELNLIQDGLVQGLVGQKYWDWGYGAVQIVYDHIVNGKEFESFTDTGMDIVTALNADAMLAAWDSNDFTQPLPDPYDMTDMRADATAEATAEPMPEATQSS